MQLMRVNYLPNDVGARIRLHEAYIDCVLEFADTDNVDKTAFGKTIMNELQNQIRTHQCDTTNVDFMNINSVRQLDVPWGHQIIFTFIAELYARYNDACDV